MKSEVENEENLLLQKYLYALQGILFLDNGQMIETTNQVEQKGGGSDHNTIIYGTPENDLSAHLWKVNSMQCPDTLCQSKIGAGAMDAMKLCGEAGWLYRRIQAYIDTIQQQPQSHLSNSKSSSRNSSGFQGNHKDIIIIHNNNDNARNLGVVPRALADFLSHQMRLYLDFIAKMEAELQQPHQHIITLRTLVVQLRVPMAQLQTLAMITDGVAFFLKGGQLLNALYNHRMHGDTRHSTLLHSVLYATSRPWFDILYLWTQQGVLQDAHEEFFIAQRSGIRDELLWADRYYIRNHQIPYGILDQDLIDLSLSVGKGINFIRVCLADDEWVLQLEDNCTQHTATEATSATHGKGGSHEIIERKKRLGYYYYYKPVTDMTTSSHEGGGGGLHPHCRNNGSVLRQTLLMTARQVNSRILESLKEQHHLLQHLWALKQFLFLGQGDFISALMDGLAVEFEKQSRGEITDVYTYTLMSVMDGALQSTNASFLPAYTLERLRVEFMFDDDNDDDDDNEDSGSYKFRSDRDCFTINENEDDKRTGWDVVTLAYDVPTPLTVIVHPQAVEIYGRVFSLLFSLKRVEYVINSTWRQSAALHHALIKSAQYNGFDLADNEGYALATIFLRNISMIRQTMLHFVGKLQSYFMFEILEGGWKRLVRQIKAAATLGQVIEAHDLYLQDVLRGCLFQEPTEGNDSDHTESQLAMQIRELLDMVKTFCSKQEALFNDALNAAERAGEKRKEAERRMNEGGWGFDGGGESLEEEDNFFGLAEDTLLQDVMAYSTEFNERVEEFLSALHNKTDGIGVQMPKMNATRRHQEATDHDAFENSLRFLTFQLDYSNYYSRNKSESAMSSRLP